MSSRKVGVNIKRLREKKGMSQEALAEKANLHRVSLVRIETGVRAPSLKMLDKIAAALGVETRKLL